MPQMSVQPREPLLAYIEANPLVYWLLPESHNPGTDSRRWHMRCHQEAQSFVAVCSRYTTPAEQIIVITSQWALIETHSGLYRDALWQNHAVPRDQRNNPRFDPRKRHPPHDRSLQQATELLERKMDKLSKIVTLRIDVPDTEIWAIALWISQKCGIYAPDCLHLATALQSGCNLLVTQDVGFLNLIHRFQRSGVIGRILQDLFASSTPPTFNACPLLLQGEVRRPGTQTAVQHLATLGYT